MNFTKKSCRTALLAAGMGLFAVQAQAAVVEVSEADFGNAKVLDFESVATGAIASTSSVFTSFGIASVSTAASDFSDGFGVRTNSSRALWADATGMVVVDPGAGSLANTVSYTIDLLAKQTRFGFGIHDQSFTMTIELFDGLLSVGSLSWFSGLTDLASLYLVSDVAFDRVVINSTNTSGGFAIDNLTLAAVPAPMTLALMGLGVVGIAARRARRRDNA